MKIHTLLAAVAFTCYGATASFAQIQILSGTPTPAPQLVSTQSDLTEEAVGLFDSTPSVSTPAREAVNPFEGLTQVLTIDGENTSEPASDDPNSLPVGRHHRQRTVVETIIDHSAAAYVPNASYAPVYWGNQMPQAPNPVAEVMLRQQCVDGLWAGYQAERAQECAAKWEHIAGKHHGCTSCKGAGKPCSTCDVQPVNRYIQSTPSCSDCAAAQPTPQHVQSAKEPTSEEKPSIFAFLPLPVRR